MTDDLAEWKRRYEDMWTREQVALARIEELEGSKGFERMTIGRLEQRVEVLSLENAKLKAQLQKKSSAFEQLKKRINEDDLINRQIFKRIVAMEESIESFKKLNQSLIDELKDLTVIKNQQDIIIVTQHALLDEAKEVVRKQKLNVL